MVGFGAVFVAAAVTLSIGIQITYRPAPLFNKYPVLDEIVGGLLGVLEGFLILVAILMITDPYYTQPTFREHGRLRRVRPAAQPPRLARPDADRRGAARQRDPAGPRVLGVPVPGRTFAPTFAQAARALLARV